MDIKKIVVIGPESTGKSTLSKALAAALQTVWVEEYARQYLEQLGRDYAIEDLLEIAKGQIASESKAQSQANQFLVCDTDLHVIKVWSEFKYGTCNSWILEQIATRKYDLYLLAAIDVPWTPDPLREHPDVNIRALLFQQYLDIVQQSNTPFVIIQGSEEQRLIHALRAIEKHLK